MTAKRRTTRLPVLRCHALVCLAMLAHAAAADACALREPTPQTGPGPHDFSVAPPDARLWREGDAGKPLFLHLRVLDTCGTPIPRAQVRILHADQDGEHHPQRWRAHLESDTRGALEVLTVYPGYAGDIARHIHFIISHPGHRELVTRLFFKSDPASAGEGRDELSIVVEEVRRGSETRLVGGYEFVLAPVR